MSDIIDCQADVLLLTAVPDELEVLLELDKNWTKGKDTSGYPIHRQTDADGRVWLLARATEMGGDAASNVATRLVTQFRPKCLAMVGVCAGWRGKVKLGDVVLADRLFRYDAGKVKTNIDNGDKEDVLLRDIKTYNLNPKWKQNAEDLATEWRPLEWHFEKPLGYEFQETWLINSLATTAKDETSELIQSEERKRKCPDWATILERLERKALIKVGRDLTLTKEGRSLAQEISIRSPDGSPEQEGASKAHIAPIGSGTQVIEDPELFPQIALSVRKVLGVEMEGSAIASVAEIEGVDHCVVAKGVSDHADPDKDDRFRPFAIEASYRFLRKIIEENLVPAQKKTLS